ncbi:MAG: hypothetical protein FWF15_05125 [Oscillospiraceae bacterium]|nr:hypothetical protein [Oscillospiraceae bacterium]
MSLRLRNEQKNYMDVGTFATPNYAYINEGFTDFSESKNSVEYARTYIGDKSERTNVTGYAPSVSYACDVYDEDPVVQAVVEITDKEMLGSDTERDIVQYNTFDEETAGSGIYKAIKRRWAVIPDSKAGGVGTDALIYTGAMKAVGAIIEGSFDISSKTFTED